MRRTRQHLVDGRHLMVGVRVGRVDDVEEQVGVQRLLEGGVEGGHEVVRQALGAGGVRQQDRAAIGSVQRRVRVSRVAKGMSAANSSEPVSRLSSVDLPAFV